MYLLLLLLLRLLLVLNLPLQVLVGCVDIVDRVDERWVLALALQPKVFRLRVRCDLFSDLLGVALAIQALVSIGVAPLRPDTLA